MERSCLDLIYRETSYRVLLPKLEIVLRIDQPAPVLETWLQSGGYVCWALLTAWNPGSSMLPKWENQARQATLEQMLGQAGKMYFAGENGEPGGDWPVEPGFFVPDLALREAGAIAEAFGQNAFVAGMRGDAPRLHWTW